MKNILLMLSVLASPLAHAADVAATLHWANRVELSLPVSGVVQAVHVDAGDRVKKGQVLLALDNTIFQAKVAESQAAIARLVAEAAEAKRDFDRVHELHERTVVATAELDQSRLRLTRANSLLAEAKANLKQQQKMLDDSALRAPYDALVLARQAEPGMSVAAGLQPQIVLIVARAGEMLARFNLPAAQIEALKTGQTVTVIVGNESYPGKVSALGWELVKNKEGSGYQVDVTFSSGNVLRAGQTVRVKLP